MADFRAFYDAVFKGFFDTMFLVSDFSSNFPIRSSWLTIKLCRDRQFHRDLLVIIAEATKPAKPALIAASSVSTAAIAGDDSVKIRLFPATNATGGGVPDRCPRKDI